MCAVICEILSLLMLGYAVVRIVSGRRDYKAVSQLVLISVFVMGCLLIFPIYLGQYAPVPAFVFTLLYGLKTMAGRQSAELIFQIPLEGLLRSVYLGVSYLVFLAAPLITSTVIINCIGDLGDRLGFWLYTHLSRRELFIFSELDPRSLALADSAHRDEKHRRAQLMFCRGKGADGKLVAEARRLGALILYADVGDLRLARRDERVSLFLINDRSEENLSAAISLNDALPEGDAGLRAYMFTGAGADGQILAEKKDLRLNVRVIDEVEQSCFELLDKQPLYLRAENGQASLLIVGGGRTGEALARAALWCGQMDGCALRITVLDRNAAAVERRFWAKCPALADPADRDSVAELSGAQIRFITADAEHDDFERALDDSCPDATYVIVAMRGDELNIETALRLRRHYLQKDVERFSKQPLICLRVRDAVHARNVESLRGYGLTTFGGIREVYSMRDLVESRLWNMALAVHMSYESPDITPAQAAAARKRFEVSAYNQAASMASAAHIRYKLFSCGLLTGEEEPTPETAAAFREKLRQPDFAEAMDRLEHRRWTAFSVCNGYRRATVEQVRRYYHTLTPPHHVHKLIKLHPAIVPWEQLPAVDAAIFAIAGKNTHFQQSDHEIVMKLPDILESAFGASEQGKEPRHGDR